jgi:predicted Zn-dependent protease
MVYTGLAKQLKLSDDELAVVLGHEMSHALREHPREQVSQQLAAQTAIGVGAALFGLGQGSADIAGMGYQSFIATRFSRTDESEADRMGLELSARAGYDPRAGVSLWQKMIDANGGSQPPEFLSSHPTDASRVQTIQSLLPSVMPLYAAARGANQPGR